MMKAWNCDRCGKLISDAGPNKVACVDGGSLWLCDQCYEDDGSLNFWIGCGSLTLILVGAAAICAFVWWIGAMLGWW